MGAAQDGRLWLGHFTRQRINMRTHHRFGQNEITVFNGIHNTAAGLRLNIHTNRAERQFALECTARHSRRGRKQRNMLHINFARW